MALASRQVSSRTGTVSRRRLLISLGAMRAIASSNFAAMGNTHDQDN